MVGVLVLVFVVLVVMMLVVLEMVVVNFWNSGSLKMTQCPYWWWWFQCDNKASQADFVFGLGVAKLDIHNANAPSFILSILRTVCSPRYSVKKLHFFFTFFFRDTLYIHFNLNFNWLRRTPGLGTRLSLKS